MKKYLEVFAPLIQTVFGDNVVLAGSLAMLQCGLIMSRPAGDLDVAIFSPTVAQLQALSALDFFRVYAEGETKYPVEAAISVKFHKAGLAIDFLLEVGKPTPEDLLLYQHKDVYYKVQRIDNTIAAKRSFIRPGGTIRSKDENDFIDLKAQNFNL